MMLDHLALIPITALLVYTRAFQQLNVLHHHIVLAAMTPYVIAIGEVALPIYAVSLGWSAVPFVGTGGSIGVVAAMLSHKKLRQLLENK